LAVRLLGAVRVSADGSHGACVRGHAARLLAWLALHPGRAWSADELAARLWSDGPPPTARTAIHGHVSRLRRLLATSPVHIETVPGGYVLRADADAIDAHRFRALVDGAAASRAEGRDDAAWMLTEALALWAGDALADVRTDPLLGAEAAALDDERRAAEDALADVLVANGDDDRALTLLGRLVNDDPLRERRWALLMIALTHAGRQTDALRAYRRAAAVLVERTGLDPGPELQRLETAILLQDPSLDAARWRPAPGSAPVPLADVVGRDADRAAVIARLGVRDDGRGGGQGGPLRRPGSGHRDDRSPSQHARSGPVPPGGRLVTLVGPGGVGKSTLAIDVGAVAAPTFADGVVVVDLGSADTDDVGSAIAAAVGAPPGGEHGGDDDPLARAAAVLARRDVLVVLDGCEHVRREAAQAAVTLLQAGPGLRVLATSQLALGVAGEAVVTIGPLSTPDEGADPASIRRSPAAALLARRLEALGCPPRDEADWAGAAAVVRAVDGLPLAIEIAAASARTEPLGAVARRLTTDASSLLTAAPPAGAGRRSLGNALDAAVERLDPEATALYATLGILPGRFDVATAAAAGGLDEPTTAAALARLADASLVVLEHPTRDRARLLQPVRAHAVARLDPAATTAALDRVVDRCATVAAELGRAAHTPDQASTIRRFTAELPTFRMVLRRLLDTGDIVRAAALFEDLVLCWGDSPASSETAVWAEELLAHADALDDGPRARLEVAVVHVQFAFELIAARLDLAEAALLRAEAAGDRFAVAGAQAQVAIGLGWRNLDLDRAAALMDAARSELLALDERYWAAVVHELQGMLQLRRFDIAGGIATLEAAAREHRAHGGPGDPAHALTYIGYARRAAGDLTGARRAFDEARRVLVDVREGSWLRATVGSAHASLALGELDDAAEAFRAAHDRAVELGDQRIVGTALVGLAAVARAEGDEPRCIALLVAAAERALSGGDPTDAVTAAGIVGEMLVERGADDEAAVVVGATDLVDDQVGVRVDFGLAHDLGPLRASLADRLGEARTADLGGDGRVIGLAAAVRRAGERLLDGVADGAGVPERAGVPGGR
jgi:DNA-binding SARP family transcriptional activator/predicted ATPase